MRYTLNKVFFSMLFIVFTMGKSYATCNTSQNECSGWKKWANNGKDRICYRIIGVVEVLKTFALMGARAPRLKSEQVIKYVLRQNLKHPLRIVKIVIFAFRI